jgi:hypothetical protein
MVTPDPHLAMYTDEKVGEKKRKEKWHEMRW